MLPTKNDIDNILITFQKKKFNKAKSLTLSFLNKYPNHPLGWKFLGAINTQLGELSEATIANQNSIKYSPNDPEVYFNYAITLTIKDNLFEAANMYQKAISIQPNYIEALNNYGIILNKLQNYSLAKEILMKSISISPNYINYLNLGNSFKGLGNTKEAIFNYEKAITFNNQLYEAYFNIGLIFSSLGKIDLSLKFFEKTIFINPNHTEAHRLISSLRKYKINDPQFSEMNRLYNKKLLNDSEKSHICFALAKYYEDIGNFKKSFNFYIEGNNLRKKLIKYDIKNDIKIFEEIKNTYYLYRDFKFYEDDEISPIFIVGLPRSGTTLIEQIVSSHTKVYGAGELPFIGNLGHLIATNNNNCSAENLKKIKRDYITYLKGIANNFTYVTDKMPLNFKYLGLINTIFPKSKIIHVSRDKAATCWSIYKHYFTSNKLGFCYDLKDIADYYNLYENLMKFWFQEIDENILFNLNYDQLTNNHFESIKELINFLSLEWEENCLNPELNSRIVDTASQLQIKKGIYKNSSNEWLKFKPFLNGVFNKTKIIL